MSTADENMHFEEVKERYGFPIGTLRHWARTGRLPTFRIGRRRFVRRSDVERLIAEALEQERAKHEVQP
jgi:predicted site-specific integrase-resolvase